MFGNFYSNIFFNISSNFCSSFFCNKTTKTTDINIFSRYERLFYFFKHSFQCNHYIHFRNSGFL